jgi:hypothetical protein
MRLRWPCSLESETFTAKDATDENAKNTKPMTSGLKLQEVKVGFFSAPSAVSGVHFARRSQC